MRSRSTGRETPMRTRTKSWVRSESAMESTPFCPAAPPPRLSRSLPSGRSTSSWTTMRSSGGTPYLPSRCTAARPERFMYVCGRAVTMSWASMIPSRTLAGPSRRSRPKRPRDSSSSRHIQPRLCRVRAYSPPGLPRPITSAATSTGHGDEVGDRLARQQAPRPGGHGRRLLGRAVVVAEAVQQAVHREKAELRGGVIRALRDGALDADGDVPGAVALAGGEGEHVGGRVDAEEASVERAQLGVIGETHRQRHTRSHAEVVTAAAEQCPKAGAADHVAVRRNRAALGTPDGDSHRRAARSAPRGRDAARGAALDSGISLPWRDASWRRRACACGGPRAFRNARGGAPPRGCRSA